ncbi:MAG: hypothetical protein PHQ34_03660 [Methanothrix sp.]|nr:hypothetical protein [Methanothrix sp.]
MRRTPAALHGGFAGERLRTAAARGCARGRGGAGGSRRRWKGSWAGGMTGHFPADGGGFGEASWMSAKDGKERGVGGLCGLWENGCRLRI